MLGIGAGGISTDPDGKQFLHVVIKNIWMTTNGNAINPERMPAPQNQRKKVGDTISVLK